MIRLNDYLYDGNTVLRILHEYSRDLKEEAMRQHNVMDLAHSNFLLHYTELLEHNEFLTSQSQRILNFYEYMTQQYPFLAFTFRGRIKSLIRTEEKYNDYIVSLISESYEKGEGYPEPAQIKERLHTFRDLIAYRFVIAIPACHLGPDDDRETVEAGYLYQIASALPEFLEEQGFSAEVSGLQQDMADSPLPENVRPYYRDYIRYPKPSGYQSLHITFYDNEARTYIEIQLRTKAMDDYAEIGIANHTAYEETQEQSRSGRAEIPEGECTYYDDAWERVNSLQKLDLSKVDVNMFSAIDNQLMNDACGLYRGRLILPFEHLSRFQNDVIAPPAGK